MAAGPNTIVAQAKAVIRWPQQQQVPLDGAYHIFGDGGGGEGIDYDAPLSRSAIPAWPDGEGKIGFGLGPFGQGAFGYGSGGAGFGYGGFGLGRFGFGAAMMRYVTPALDDGTYELAVVGYDAAANRVTPATATAEVTIAGTPDPPGVPTAAKEDPAGSVKITWPLSADDRAAQ